MERFSTGYRNSLVLQGKHTSIVHTLAETKGLVKEQTFLKSKTADSKYSGT
jgi:hypothetical protein